MLTALSARPAPKILLVRPLAVNTPGHPGRDPKVIARCAAAQRKVTSQSLMRNVDVNRTPREQVERAVCEGGSGAPLGKVIAELMFGFWRYLSRSRYEAWFSGSPSWIW